MLLSPRVHARPNRRNRTIRQLNGDLTQELSGPAAAEPVLESPRQDPPGIVVDHGMQIRSRSVEQPNDRDVDVKKLARIPTLGLAG